MANVYDLSFISDVIFDTTVMGSLDDFPYISCVIVEATGIANV